MDPEWISCFGIQFRARPEPFPSTTPTSRARAVAPASPSLQHRPAPRSCPLRFTQIPQRTPPYPPLRPALQRSPSSLLQGSQSTCVLPARHPLPDTPRHPHLPALKPGLTGPQHGDRQSAFFSPRPQPRSCVTAGLGVACASHCGSSRPLRMPAPCGQGPSLCFLATPGCQCKPLVHSRHPVSLLGDRHRDRAGCSPGPFAVSP